MTAHRTGPPATASGKRTRYRKTATALLLGINGYPLTASEEEAAVQILALADSRLSDAELTAWLAGNCARQS